MLPRVSVHSYTSSSDSRLLYFFTNPTDCRDRSADQVPYRVKRIRHEQENSLPPPDPPVSRLHFLIVIAFLHATAVRGEVDYERDIKPIFDEKCAACHGVLKQEAGLRLDAGALVRQGSENGQVIDSHSPESSLLLQRITATDLHERMPPETDGTPLAVEQVQQLTQWIGAGAPSPADELIIDSPRRHWAYHVPKRTSPSQSVPDTWRINQIDAIAYEKWTQAGVVPTPITESSTLLRRLYLDLVGVPPTLEEQKVLAVDPQLKSWDAQVDQLLADPRHGERWARHWMDVWRYSDWDGFKQELRGSARHIWHWRDWIVESLNRDKGYDRMLIEMLAGDEVAPDNFDTLRATGFLVRNFHKSNRDIWLDATVEHSAKAFLGMTLACARCHDHKYDPLSQREYYAFRAIFEPHRVRTERLPGITDINNGGLPRVYDADLDAPTFLYQRGNEKQPDKENPLTADVPAILGLPFEIHAIDLPAIASHPFRREYIETDDIAVAVRDVDVAQRAIENSVQPAIARQSLTVAEQKLHLVRLRWEATNARLDNLSNAQAIAKQAADSQRMLAVHQGLLSLMTLQAAEKPDATKIAAAQKQLADASSKLTAEDSTFTAVAESYPSTSSGRRLAFAKWLTHESNPLTARVAVNHIWLHHFGEPLVENVFDFGLRSPQPVLARLLDFLALELMQNDWSMKHIHRLIVTSKLYRLSSSVNDLSPEDRENNLVRDADNRLHWRANLRRLDAEVVRDSLLAIAGNLQTAIGGEEIDYQLGEAVPRRSLYFGHAYEKQMTMLVVFDAANPTDCYRRTESIVPQQSLALANSVLALDQSRRLAARLIDSVTTNIGLDDIESANGKFDDDEMFISRTYQSILSRHASSDELTACIDFLQSQSQTLADLNQLTTMHGQSKATIPPSADARQRARENLVHVLINHNDFVTVR